MKKKCRQWMGLLLLGVLLFTEGCAGREYADAGWDSGQRSPEETAEGGTGRETGMGRYLEQEITLPEEITSLTEDPEASVRQLDNGDLALMEKRAGLYLSSDQGATWIRKPTPWHEELNAWISQISIAPDGAVTVIYNPYEEEISDGTAVPDSDADAGPEDSETDAEVPDLYAEYAPEYLYVDPEGNTKKLEAPDPENWIRQFWFGNDSGLYACDLNGKVYRMDAENGMAKELFEIEGLSEYVCFTDHEMIVFTSRNDVMLYDLEAGTTVEDQVLRSFVKNSAQYASDSEGEGYSLMAAAGEQEDVLYLAYHGGLYRHVLGGSAMEQLSDGSMSSLGDLRTAFCGFAVLPEDEFLVLYDHAKLYRYVYDPDIPTVPEEQIHLYSLTEDYTIRQAVSLFQRQHPEVYVHYEAGLSPDGSLTREDAVKNLNARILSGSGPDLLVLDGMPVRSYEEKGVLTDLSGIVHELGKTDPLFKNLVDACRLDGRLYYVPVRFRLPLLVGDRACVEQVEDLASLADAVETLRGAYPEGALTGLRTEEEVLRTLTLTCGAAWTDSESGTVRKEKLTEFLESARRIYQAEISGFGEEELEEDHENNYEDWQQDVAEEGMYHAVASKNAVHVAMETQKLGAGFTYRMDCEFNTVSTLANQEENFAYAPWQGQIKDGFIPKSMVGICAGSEEKEPVLAFFRFLYGRELQDLDLPAGYPINEASFEKLRKNPRKVYENSGIIVSDETGSLFTLEIRWSPERDFERLLSMARSARTVCTGEAEIEEIVRELGRKAVNGSADVEDTVEEIVKRISIKLSE